MLTGGQLTPETPAEVYPPYGGAKGDQSTGLLRSASGEAGRQGGVGIADEFFGRGPIDAAVGDGDAVF